MCVLVCGAAILVAAAICTVPETWAAERGKPAPEIDLPYAGGGRFKLSDFKGKVVLISFWATWCPPCREEMPTMEKSYKDYKKKGFTVIGVNTDVGAMEKVSGFIRELNLSFPIVGVY